MADLSKTVQLAVKTEELREAESRLEWTEAIRAARKEVLLIVYDHHKHWTDLKTTAYRSMVVALLATFGACMALVWNVSSEWTELSERVGLLEAHDESHDE